MIVLCCVTRCVRPWKVSEKGFVQFGGNADWCRMRWMRPPRGSKNLYCISKVFFSKAEILIAFRCGGWGRQEEAKIFIVFHVMYRGGSAAEGDRQADRRISTYAYTHTCTSTHQTHQCNQAHSEMLWTYKCGRSIW